MISTNLQRNTSLFYELIISCVQKLLGQAWENAIRNPVANESLSIRNLMSNEMSIEMIQTAICTWKLNISPSVAVGVSISYRSCAAISICICICCCA